MPTQKPNLDFIAQLVQTNRDLNLFRPEDAHRKAKSTFWSHFLSGDTPVPSPLDLAAAARFCGDKRISQWWDLPGFQDWFTNADEFKQRVEFLSQLALDGLEEILRARDARPGDKLTAIKMIMEIGSKVPGRKTSEDSFLDEAVRKMDKKQLEQFIQSRLRLLPTTPTPSTPEE